MNCELLVREALACYGLGDLEGYLSFLSPDVEWLVHSGPPLPFGGSIRGREAVSEFFSSTARILQISGVLWSNFISQENQTALYGLASHRCLANGCLETAAFAHWYEVSGEHIIRVQQFLDTASIQRMLEGKPALRPTARNAANTSEAIGLLASVSQQIDAEDEQDFRPLLGLYGADAPPRSITLMENADRNIEWNSSGMGSLPTGGPFYGIESFGRHVDLTRQLLGEYSLIHEGHISVGNTIALHGRLQLDPLHFDPSISPHWFQALTLREGRIMRGVEVLDSQALLQALQSTPGKHQSQ